MAVFAPRGLSEDLIKKLDDFLQDPDIDFRSLYKSYDWEWDTHSDDFPDIYRLEVLLEGHANVGEITLDDIYKVARWGGMGSGRARKISIKNTTWFTIVNHVLSNPNSSTRIRGSKDSLLCSVEKKPENTALCLRESTTGLGPTYVSKVLRFALPQHYGAIDTRLVRVFGEGDQKYRQHHWLTLKVSVPGNWRIDSSQKNWPSEYGTWINILRYFAQSLNEQKLECPHPEAFVKSELRKDNAWTCADVEMALFAYASKHVKN